MAEMLQDLPQVAEHTHGPMAPSPNWATSTKAAPGSGVRAPCPTRGELRARRGEDGGGHEGSEPSLRPGSRISGRHNGSLLSQSCLKLP